MLGSVIRNCSIVSRPVTADPRTRRGGSAKGDSRGAGEKGKRPVANSAAKNGRAKSLPKRAHKTSPKNASKTEAPVWLDELGPRPRLVDVDLAEDYLGGSFTTHHSLYLWFIEWTKINGWREAWAGPGSPARCLSLLWAEGLKTLALICTYTSY